MLLYLNFKIGFKSRLFVPTISRKPRTKLKLLCFSVEKDIVFDVFEIKQEGNFKINIYQYVKRIEKKHSSNEFSKKMFFVIVWIINFCMVHTI